MAVKRRHIYRSLVMFDGFDDRVGAKVSRLLLVFPSVGGA